MELRQKRFRLVCYASLVMTLLLLVSCSEGDRPLPKPKGYFRIDLPEKNYVKVDTIERYAFEAPDYAVITNDPLSPNEKNWINVVMPHFKASIHLTHKVVNNNLGEYLEDVHTMLTKHLQKANGMNDSLIINPKQRVYGMLIEMDGKGVATPLQFYLTDSTANFVRGALYFNFVPNNDSMQPVIDYLRQDIDKMINTFEWK
ncbi:MAG: gliding motility lipoprotein GldD [Bacteroidales bacterium]|nr:gliding motility lipoprotein GldD [Bacteroidales bacterium]